MTDLPDALRLRNLQKSFDKKAVDGLDLTIKPGEVYALLGANGAGKTTTLRMVAGLLQPDAGEIFVDGIDARKNPIAAKSRIAWLPDEPLLYDKLTPLEYLEFVAGLWGMRAEKAGPRAENLLRRLNLWEQRNQRCEGFSRGKQQKTAIGRALMTEPKLLMLDEPSLGLAPFLVAEIFQIISTISRDEGLSVLLVEQNAVAALDIVSHGYLIENGRIVMHDSTEALKRNPDIQEFYLGGAKGKDFRDIKHYSRRKRWLT